MNPCRQEPVKFTIANLLDHAHVGPTLACWHAAEWGHLYNGPGSTWNEQIATQEFAEMKRSEIPLTFVALHSSSNELLGSISLIADDELQGFEHLTPWLASLYVVSHARSFGIARALINEVVVATVRLGFERVFLFTAGQERYYLDQGWEIVARTRAHDHDAVVMSRTV
jgi:predicted N-acetyltransferase YhbS